MSITFRVGRHIDPSGFGLAVVDIPELDAEKNISLIDYSHRWEENISSADSSITGTYVDNGGNLPRTTLSQFLVTNEVSVSRTDTTRVVPLFYRHKLRFYHFSYGQNPGKQIYITDADENILNDVSYIVRSERVSGNVYRVNIVTDLINNESIQYKVKYNRCLSDGSSIFPGWVETLNSQPLFSRGNPWAKEDQYDIIGPDDDGFYTAVVPPVPTLSQLTNSIGLSFENAPTIIATDVDNNVSSYEPGIVVRYTLKASGTTTFTIKRSSDRFGAGGEKYLQSATTDSWGTSPVNFTIGTTITGLYGMSLYIGNDRYLVANDEAYFTAKRSYYYVRPISYRSIYLKKPKYVTANDDWYISIRNGRFRRRMDASGVAVPSGVAGSKEYEYAIPEYNYQMWDLTWGPPYKNIISERAEILDKQTIQLQETPIFIDASSVLNNVDNPGFPPTGYLKVTVNDQVVPESNILDWDIYNGTVKLAQYLNQRDDVKVGYSYEENFYKYTGFMASGVLGSGFVPLDLNPTPSHNYGMYASGVLAHIFLKPYAILDDGISQPTAICNDVIYHNNTGVADGVFDFNIGILSTGPHCKIDDLQITDVRTRGGGLSKLGIKDVEKVVEVQPESEFFWDIGYFDGQAVPSNGVIVVKIPKTVLSTNGGKFEEDEVRKKCQKHAALGTYTIVEFI